jgi:hypothetical protein
VPFKPKKESTTMDPAQAAVIWTLVIMQDAQPRRSKPAKPRRSFAGRFEGELRRIVFRAQLGPVGGHSPA